MKKVYFACSIRGGGDKSLYPALVAAINERAKLLTEVFIQDGLRLSGSPMPASDIWQRDMDWIKEADCIIAEVTNPSLGVGYEIAKAEEMGKPILCLYRTKADKKLSAMISGSPHPQIMQYQSLDDALSAIEKFLR